MKKLKKKEYTTPIIERLEARVECGFAGSNGTSQPQDMSGSSMENYGQGIGNGDGGYTFN